MPDISGKQGKELIVAILEELRNLDPRIVPYESDEIQSLEYGVVQAVRDIFGSGSPEYGEFEEFRIAAGHITRGDSRSEKQEKYELGIPKAVARLEGLLSIVEESVKHEEPMGELDPGDLVEVKPAAKAPAPKTAASRAPEKPKAKEPAAGTAAAAPAAKPAQPQKKPAPAGTRQPGRILLLQEGGNDITKAVASLLEKVGIEIAFIDDDRSSEMERISGLKDIAFTIMPVPSGPKGGLSGLTSVIGKPHPKHDSIFKLGLLVGILGPGKVLILHGGDRPQDIPEELFGVRYIPYKEEGGWQIGLLKLLKANSFFIDANLLFD